MDITEKDLDRMAKAILEEDNNEELLRDSVSLEDNILKFKVYDVDADEPVAVRALMNAGLNVYSDDNVETVEHFATWANKSRYVDITIILTPNSTLWR